MLWFHPARVSGPTWTAGFVAGPLLSILLLALLAPASGCGTASVDAEEEAEHHVPEHRPADYEQLVGELRTRLTDLRTPNHFPSRADAETLRGQLREIIGWIPELAAESDLRKQEWEDVRRVAGELAAAYERNLGESADELARTPPVLAASAEIDRLVDALDAYREAARRDNPPREVSDPEAP